MATTVLTTHHQVVYNWPLVIVLCVLLVCAAASFIVWRLTGGKFEWEHGRDLERRRGS